MGRSRDTDTTAVVFPPELAAELERRPALKRAFEAMPVSHVREYVKWIAEAKRAQTRATRAEKAIAMVSHHMRSGD